MCKGHIRRPGIFSRQLYQPLRQRSTRTNLELKMWCEMWGKIPLILIQLLWHCGTRWELGTGGLAAKWWTHFFSNPNQPHLCHLHLLFSSALVKKEKKKKNSNSFCLAEVSSQSVTGPSSLEISSQLNMGVNIINVCPLAGWRQQVQEHRQ